LNYLFLFYFTFPSNLEACRSRSPNWFSFIFLLEKLLTVLVGGFCDCYEW